MAYQWVTDRVHTRHVALAEVNANNALLLNGTPLARTYDLNTRLSSDQGDIVKISAVEALLMPALRGHEDFKGQLSLISDARVSRVEFEEDQGTKRAKAVRVVFSEPYEHNCVVKDLNNLRTDRDKEYVVKAKNIILSAGSLGSAEVLLRSNLSNEHIGRGVVLHPSMGVIGTFDRKINALEGISASVYAPAPDASYFFEAMSERPNYVAAIHPGNGHDVLETIRHFNQLGGFGVMVVDSVSPENRVVINPKTKESQILYWFSEQDKTTMKRGLSEAIKLLLRQGAQTVILPTSEDIFGGRYSPIRTEREADAIVDRMTLADGFNFVSSAHMQGTNKLSKDASSGVVSPRFRVWDTKHQSEISNFYVCDSSVFPTSVGANPMQSIYTIAKLFTDQILVNQK
jgi:choline dehydrogenase-like flavoprotein